jgi:plastocyanin
MKIDCIICASTMLLMATGFIRAQALPAPTVDRVGFPAGYQTSFTKLLTVDRPDNGQIRVIYGNSQAASVPWWRPFPYGSVLLFESWTPKRNTEGGLLFDGDGRLVPDTLGTIFVMRKEVGFGADYTQTRNGEWEYVAYRPDGSTATSPQNSGACTACHLQGGPTRDWVFRRQQFGTSGGGAIPTMTMSQYAFIPGDVTVKKGTTVVIRNDDDIDHQPIVPELPANANGMIFGETWTQKFEKEGTYTVKCLIHSGMKATITVTK